MSQEIRIFNKSIGFVKEDGGHKSFITFRNYQLHFFKKFCGYGINASVLMRLNKEGIEFIKFIVKMPDGTKRKLTSTITSFLEYGKLYQNEENGVKENQIILHQFFFKS